MLKKHLAEKLKAIDNIEFYNPESDSAICSFNVKGIFAGLQRHGVQICQHAAPDGLGGGLKTPVG